MRTKITTVTSTQKWLVPRYNRWLGKKSRKIADFHYGPKIHKNRKSHFLWQIFHGKLPKA
uniref:Uncharacterized protein n=1 Tax=Rhizophora mucronata TaxID=61149 RepID=A0A2P2N944_RHIMU